MDNLRWPLAKAAAAILLAMHSAQAATPAVSAGDYFTIGLHADGTLRSWGSDRTGELGIARQIRSITPQAVPAPSDVARRRGAIAVGQVHALALDANGSVWAWGGNGNGQLGDGSTTDRPEAVRIAAPAGATTLAAGGDHSVALTSDGSVWTWGRNLSGELGDGTTTARNLPLRVPGLQGVTAISAGVRYTMALRSDGSVWAWGDNSAGQLGDGTTQNRLVPVRVAIEGVTAIAAGALHSLALKADGSVWAWGQNNAGQLGDGSTIQRTTPVLVPGITATRIAVGGRTALLTGTGMSFALRSDGALVRWGTQATSPIVLGIFPGALDMVCGENFVLVIDANRQVWSWGANDSGQLGYATADPRPLAAAQPVPGVTSIAAIAAGGGGTAVAVDAQGRLRSWGSNSNGQLGIPQQLTRSVPSTVAGLTNATQVSAGGNGRNQTGFALALRGDGSLWGWGAARALGSSSFGSSSSTPIPITLNYCGPTEIPVTGVTQVSAGGGHVLALRDNGTVLAWGDNAFAQLALEGGVFACTAGVVIPGLSDVVRVSAGRRHSVAVRRDGSVWAWGNNEFGQLGFVTTQTCQDPSLVPRPCSISPRRVPVSDIVDVSAGARHTLAIKADGTVLAWGDNTWGQLGDGTLVSRSTPAPVQGLREVVQVSAGGDEFDQGPNPSRVHSVARKRDGTVWTWGANRDGQLGDGSNVDRASPVQVPGLSEVVGVSAGLRHTSAIRADGVVFTWGNNRDGQLGDGTVANRNQGSIVVRENGASNFAASDWYLDLDPRFAAAIPPDKVPQFPVVAFGSTESDSLSVSANVRFRPESIGSTGGIYVFALAPADRVQGSQAADAFKIGFAKNEQKVETPIACVLAQLNAAGNMVAVSSANLAAYLTGVLSAQGASVSILNGVPASGVSGATFFVGYGPTAGAMIDSGTNRATATVPGSLECRPSAPQTGWWWNPAEDGRGFSLERRGNNLFFAAFLYDVSGRSTWYVSTGAVSLEGSLYNGDLLSASGGQTLGGPYTRFPTLRSVGPMTLTFNNEATGTMVWPGGTVPIRRFEIIQDGLTLPAVEGQPESGWWWNEQESGRGFFLEFQNGWLDIAGYMYDDDGNSVWYLTVGQIGGTAMARSFSGSWWSYANGQALTGPWRPNARVNSNVAPVTITFTGTDTALMTLPNGRTTNLRRHRF